MDEESPIDQEDLKSAGVLTRKITETMVEAFRKRFPVLDYRSLFIITTSCACTALSVILSVPEEEKRELLFEDFLHLFRNLYKQGNQLSD